MEIAVIVASGSFAIYPEPAFVSAGEFVMWRIHVNRIRPGKFRATVYFDKKSPFAREEFQNEREVDENGQATIPVEGEKAEEKGDFKYGVKIEQEGNIIIDVDPWLHVR